MKKAILLMLIAVPLISACGVMSKCESEPIVAENHKLIVPPNFGQMPK